MTTKQPEHNRPPTMQTDTHPDVEKVFIDGLRQMSAAERVSRVLRLTQAVREMARAGIAKARPDLSPREQQLLFVEVHYGREWAERLRDYLAKRDE